MRVLLVVTSVARQFRFCQPLGTGRSGSNMVPLPANSNEAATVSSSSSFIGSIIPVVYVEMGTFERGALATFDRRLAPSALGCAGERRLGLFGGLGVG